MSGLKAKRASTGRIIAVAVTCISLLSQATFASTLHPAAQTFSLQNWKQTAQALRPRFMTTIRPTAAQINQKNVEGKYKSTHIGQAGRVLILMTALAGVELVRRQARQAKLSGKTLSTEEYSKLAAEAALKVADSGDVWFGIASDLGIGAISKKPVAALNEVLKNKVARPIFINLIQSGIMSLIYFVGFQACAQLWRDARLMLDPKDYDKSERIWSMGFSALVDTANSNNNSDEARITRLMIGNVAKILFFDDELRENWFYNTWRLAIATGRFVTLVTGIITATTVGTTLFPGAGTILGFMFALTGALAAAALPASFTEKVTFKLKDVRIAFAKHEARQFNWRLKKLIDAYSNENIFWQLMSSKKEITKTFELLTDIRERVTTAFIEEIYLANTNIQKYTHELEVAKAHKRIQAANEAQNLLERQTLYRNGILQKMVSFYRLQFKNLDKIKVTSTTPLSVIGQLDKQKVEVASIHSFLKTFSQALVQPSLYPSSEQVLQNFYLRSFKEPTIFRISGIPVDSNPR